jgi:uncharacterized protein YlzI (FlbEa/FlbD family)
MIKGIKIIKNIIDNVINRMIIYNLKIIFCTKSDFDRVIVC